MSEEEYYTLPNGQQITYIDETHQYFVNGIEIISITRMLDDKYGNSYTKVDPEILLAASQYGTKVHEELSEWIEWRRESPSIPVVSNCPEVKDYFNHVEIIYNIRSVMNEKIVALYDLDGKIVACGRFDMICYINDELTLIDFKTTSNINKQHVMGQLNLYLKAARQSGYIDKTEEVKLGVIHLSKGKARLVPIPVLSEDFYLTFLI